MAGIKYFEEIESWRLARELALKIWEKTQQGSFARDYALKDQINKSCGSTMDNIAEGHGRGSNGEFITFLAYARASNQEVKSQLYRALDRRHLTEAEHRELFSLANKVGTKILNFINYLKQSSLKGPRLNR